MAEISGGLWRLPSTATRTSPFSARSTVKGTILRSSCTSSYLRPMKRLIEKIVFLGLVTACRFATCPTRRSPVLVKATTEGVVRLPSALGITLASLPSITATTLLVVPRSIPMILLTRSPPSVHGRAYSLTDEPSLESLVALSQIYATHMLTIRDADLFPRTGTQSSSTIGATAAGAGTRSWGSRRKLPLTLSVV